MTTIAVGNRRLLRLAAIVAKSKTYNQARATNECGSPGCVIGHIEADPFFRRLTNSQSFYEDLFAMGIMDWLSITATEGCNNAGRSGKKAAKHIRNFVKGRS